MHQTAQVIPSNSVSLSRHQVEPLFENFQLVIYLYVLERVFPDVNVHLEMHQCVALRNTSRDYQSLRNRALDIVVAMSKRKLHIDGESSDDFEVYTPVKPARRSKSTQQKKKLRGTSPQVGDLEAETKAEPHSHPVSLHILSSPETPRVALLAWFDVVCDSRGMPWRKQFDPSFGRDERAQRAYEVW
jgi:hypothetical protein